MSDSNTCPQKEDLLALAEGRLGEAHSLQDLEAHLSRCPECRSTLENMLSSSADSGLLLQVADWRPEQEKFKPVFQTVIDSSFRLAKRIDLSKFAFVDSVDGNLVSGKIGLMELKELIGSGGMGAVFRAYDPELDRDVAVKALRPELAGREDVAHLFLDEARAAAALHHENVLPIYHVAREDGEICSFVMPVIEGGSLADLLAESEGALPFDRVLDIATKATKALAAAHAEGIVHRDVKPANILVEANGPGVWLADFGLARAAQHGFGEGMIVGTPDYAAPEVMQGKEGTIQSDLYSLGKVFREMIRGKGATEKEVPHWFEKLADNLQDENPSARPTSAEEVLENIESNLADEWESKSRQHAQRHVRRSVGWIVGALVGVVVLAWLIDAFAGLVVTNTVIRQFTGNPISVDGKWGSFSSIEEALQDVDGDATIRIAKDAQIGVSERLDFSGRALRLLSRPGGETEVIFQKGLDYGMFEIKNGSLEIKNVTLRYRGTGVEEPEALISLYDSSAFLENLNTRRHSSGNVSKTGRTIFVLRGNSEATVRNCSLMTERTGKAAIAVSTESTKKKIAIIDCKFVGENLVHVVCPESTEESGTVDIIVENSTILTTCHFRMGRGAGGVRTEIQSSESLWQFSGPVLNFRNNESDGVRRNFHFHDKGSFIAVGRTEAIYSAGLISSPRLRATRGNPELAEADWEDFWQDSPNISLEKTQWVSWIVDFTKGRNPEWNPELDLTKWVDEIEYSEFFQ